MAGGKRLSENSRTGYPAQVFEPRRKRLQLEGRRSPERNRVTQIEEPRITGANPPQAEASEPDSVPFEPKPPGHHRCRNRCRMAGGQSNARWRVRSDWRFDPRPHWRVHRRLASSATKYSFWYRNCCADCECRDRRDNPFIYPSLDCWAWSRAQKMVVEADKARVGRSRGRTADLKQPIWACALAI